MALPVGTQVESEKRAREKRAWPEEEERTFRENMQVKGVCGGEERG